MTETKQSVLVVDDTPENIDILVGILRDSYAVRVAGSGERALRLAAEHPPDLILLDIMMPGLDGFEVCRRLKADVALQGIPVVFISALDRVQDKVDAFASGGVDYVTKPFQPAEVEARVAVHLELRRKRQELAEALSQLRDLEQLRDSLVHMVIHDLRSPLTGVLGMAELLRDDLKDQLTAQQNGDFDEMLTSGSSLREMVSSVLDVSRMESGEMPLTRSASDLGPVVRDALTSLVALVKQCHVVFDPPKQSVVADCDAEVITRVVANLVSNAIKFTPRSGEVRITADVDDGMVTVRVADTGPGIPPESCEKIFEKFGQVQGSQNRRKYSTGLGLAFCRLAVEAHGGKIGVESEVGKGSVFWFTLPAANA
ncbi:MAG: hybrid sensor histidine kinase/response regulator [Lentisphaerae bacterium]|jgi:two-component system, sensor histidine kinase and response regulator|nr:hybrid sensor histidine kinase/response regulator [Lentisphaerota bacterium]MBT4818614.1 hybrid sensor histidine kinase/response regulator [Lentisphaerota bacterium]MBT5604488.1 hybrid sensor histidine kinase/response regulator [Lentisphaerota bacterium]MBT7060489.1 hybrid sensor histidine kinase/response regulator [Lentisphaerota bacterium]MBT7844396.1 hybrid sensor histidine kinase/response regulator [Lentisphaerota bacterium]